jgi:5-hydroxyisourate hydrolase-like protein (transthyretin family)
MLESFQINHPTVYKIVGFILKALLLLFILFWSFVQIYFNTQDFGDAIDSFEAATSLDTDQFRNEGTIFSNPRLNQVYEDVFSILFITATVSAVLGVLLLAQNRNLLEVLLLFLTFAVPKQRKYWGKIYFKSSGAPASFATVRLLAADPKTQKETIISQTVTDLDGRYRFLLPTKEQRKYTLEVQASDFKPVRQSIAFDAGLLQKNEIIEDVALDAAAGGADQQQSLWHRLRPQLQTVFIYYLYVLTIIAFIHSLYGVLVFPELDTFIFIALYGYGLVWNTLFIRDRLGRNQGYIKDKYSKEPLAGVQVLFFQADKQVGSFTTDEDGNLKTPLPAGMYSVQAGKQGYDMVRTEDLPQVRVGQDGHILSDLALVRNEQATTTLSGQTLANPFA